MGWGGRIGLTLVALAVAAASLSLVWTPFDPGAIDIAARLQPSSLVHPFGTDQLGRDLLSMLMAGARPSLAVAAVGALIGLVVGVPLGLLAAARPGWIDELVARASDIVFAFPALILAMLIVAIAGPGASRAAIAIGIFNIPVFARVTRALGRSLWPRDYVLAARLAGKGRAAIAIEHILPNIAMALLVQATVQLSLGLVAEAGLSFLGLGVQPPSASWGRMLADGQTLIAVAPRLVLLPGIAIGATVLGFNLAADALQRRLA